jgi:hypothetical protein
VPETLPVGTPKITSPDFLAGEITFVSRDRMKYVGHNRFLRNIIYCTIGPDFKLYLKSQNPQAYYLENVQFSGVFENSAEAAKMQCDSTSANTKCDPLDMTYPLEEALVPLVIEFIVKELTGAIYKPADTQNNAADDLSGITPKGK